LGGCRSSPPGGWQLSTVTLVETGPFLTPTVSAAGDPANINTNGRLISVIRPDLVGSATGNVSNPTPDHWFDINAFTATPELENRWDLELFVILA
jgi:hypothetical protein